MKNSRIALAAIVLAALAASGFSTAKVRAEAAPAAQDCCAEGGSCCQPPAGCCTK